MEQLSEDGTRKFLWRLADGEAIESVLIPIGIRRTLCISSQAGCALALLLLRDRAGWASGATSPPFEIAGQVREIVLPGSGRRSRPTSSSWAWASRCSTGRRSTRRSRILNSPEGLGIGARHITVSTVGILPGLEAFARRPEQFRLAISLHATTLAAAAGHHADREEVRSRGGAPRPRRRSGKRVTFEYVMIGGVNDRDADADRLAEARPAASERWSTSFRSIRAARRT